MAPMPRYELQLRHVVLFETEEDMRQGDATLSSMSPPNDGMGRRAGVDFYEVAVDLRA
jgi:hypothetical protein